MMGICVQRAWFTNANATVNAGTKIKRYHGPTLLAQLKSETAFLSSHPYNAAPNVMPMPKNNE